MEYFDSARCVYTGIKNKHAYFKQQESTCNVGRPANNVKPIQNNLHSCSNHKILQYLPYKVDYISMLLYSNFRPFLICIKNTLIISLNSEPPPPPPPRVSYFHFKEHPNPTAPVA